MAKGGSTKIINCMTPWAEVLGRCLINHIVKMLHFFKNLHINSEAWFRQTKCMVMMTKEGITKIVNVLTPGLGL